jgi:hypothetical protein
MGWKGKGVWREEGRAVGAEGKELRAEGGERGSGVRGQGLEEGMDGGFDGDLGHAGEVDGAVAEEAGVTGGTLAEDVVFGVAGESGAGEFGGGGAEGGDDGDIEGGGDVHGAGVIGEEGVAAFEEGAELAERGFAGGGDWWGEVGVEVADLLVEILGQVEVSGAAEDEEVAAGFLLG